MKKRGPWFRKAPPLNVEFLEDRVTPSAVFELWAGTLTIGGSDGPDFIRVGPLSYNANDIGVTVNNDVRSFALVEVLRLRIDAKAGNDTVIVADSITIAVWIGGGPGDDFIRGGSGNDLLDGGTGSDHIEGAAGDDVIQGGFGDDTILGGAGNDQIDGDVIGDQPNAGAPTSPAVIAAATAELDSTPQSDGSDSRNNSDNTAAGETNRPGNDQIFGDAGDDTIRGGGGDDVIVGGSGNDQLLGESGNDSIHGGAGTDLIDGGPGADHLIGNSRKDAVHIDASDTQTSQQQAVVVQAPRPTDGATTAVQASDVDQLLASARNELPPRVQQPAPASVAPRNAEVPANARPIAVPLDDPAAAASSVTVRNGAGTGAGLIGQVIGRSPEAGDGAKYDADTSRPEPSSVSPVSEQVDLLLNGALLTEATSDGPTQSGFAVSKRERRRPTFLYIKPIPLPDLVPDIELPLPK